MGTTIASRAERLLGRMAAIALVALLLAGLAAAPAEARTRDDGVKDANDFIDSCIREGGDPIVVEGTGDNIMVVCSDLPGGKDLKCTFYPVYDCWSSRVIPADLPDQDIEQTDAPVVRPELADPVGVGGILFAEDGATVAPLRSSRIIGLSGSAVVPAEEAAGNPITLSDITAGPTIVPALAPMAEEVEVPALDEDEVVTTQPVPEPVADVITVPEIEEDEVVTIQPILGPAAEVIPVPELDEDTVGSIPPVPVADEIPVPQVEGDTVGSIPPAPVADEIPVSELGEDVVGTTASVPPADEQP